jgi:hypothetical protein
VVAVFAERRLGLGQNPFARPALARGAHANQTNERSDGDYDLGQFVG